MTDDKAKSQTRRLDAWDKFLKSCEKLKDPGDHPILIAMRWPIFRRRF